MLIIAKATTRGYSDIINHRNNNKNNNNNNRNNNYNTTVTSLTLWILIQVWRGGGDSRTRNADNTIWDMATSSKIFQHTFLKIFTKTAICSNNMIQKTTTHSQEGNKFLRIYLYRNFDNKMKSRRLRHSNTAADRSR